MSAIRIDNNTDDGITVIFNGEEYIVEEDGKINIPNVTKGSYSIRIHRTRIPKESADINNGAMPDFATKMNKSDESIHTQLCGVFEININSSKAVLTVTQKVSSITKMSVDAIMSGFSILASGAAISNQKNVFDNKDVRKNFVKHQLKNAFFPIGIGGIVILLVGFFSIIGNIIGQPLTFSDRVFTLPWSLGITAIGAACMGYVIYAAIFISLTAKKYDETKQ